MMCHEYTVLADVTPYALTSKAWAREIRSLYYTYCSVLRREHATGFLRSVHDSAVGSNCGGRWIRVIDFGFCPPSSDMEFWKGFEAAILHMVHLERFNLCYSHHDPGSVRRWGERAHLFPSTLRTLYLHPPPSEFHLVMKIKNLLLMSMSHHSPPTVHKITRRDTVPVNRLLGGMVHMVHCHDPHCGYA